MTHSQIEELDLIDRYLLRNLPPDLEAQFIEHFLACPECTEKLELGRPAVEAIREIASSPHEQGGREHGKSLPWLLPAAGLALILLASGTWLAVRRKAESSMQSRPQTASRTAGAKALPAAAEELAQIPVLTLESYRGESTDGARVRASEAAKAFELRLGLTGIARHDSYSVEIASRTGEVVWSARVAAPGAEALVVRVEKAPLGPGAYWVRIYESGAAAERALLREYSLIVDKPEEKVGRKQN